MPILPSAHNNHVELKSRNLTMNAGEFGIEQVNEVDSYDFEGAGAASQSDILKNASYGYVAQNEVKFEWNKPAQRYVDQSENLSTNEHNLVQIKNENDVGTIYEDIKREIVEENHRFCGVCNKNFSSEADFIQSKNERFGCNCQEQYDSRNQQDSVSQLLKLKDEPISEEGYGNKQVSLTAPQVDSFPLLDKELTPTNIPDDLLFPKRKCYSMSVENALFVRPQVTDMAEKTFQCRYCSKSFIEMIDLQVHERIGHSDHMFRCRFCWKSFLHVGNFRIHVKSHENYRQCKTCKKTFNRSYNFRSHEKTHSEKTFHCKICPKSFSVSYYLNRHEKVHAKIKIFSKSISTPRDG